MNTPQDAWTALRDRQRQEIREIRARHWKEQRDFKEANPTYKGESRRLPPIPITIEGVTYPSIAAANRTRRKARREALGLT